MISRRLLRNMEDEKQKLVTRIQEAIVELKNKVELMLDLAYSCVMMNDREVAKEVEHLEEYIDWLHTQYELLILTLIERYGGKMEGLGMLRLGVSTENIADSAARIAETIIKGLEPHPILTFVAKEGEEFVSTTRIRVGSYLDGKTIKGSGIEEKLGVRIIAVRRGKNWFFDPPDDFKLQPEDVLLIRGYIEAIDDLKKYASVVVKKGSS